MADYEVILQRIQMMVAQSKKIERESRILKQQAARVRDDLQAGGLQGNEQSNTSKLEEG